MDDTALADVNSIEHLRKAKMKIEIREGCGDETFENEATKIDSDRFRAHFVLRLSQIFSQHINSKTFRKKQLGCVRRL